MLSTTLSSPTVRAAVPPSSRVPGALPPSGFDQLVQHAADHDAVSSEVRQSIEDESHDAGSRYSTPATHGALQRYSHDPVLSHAESSDVSADSCIAVALPGADADKPDVNTKYPQEHLYSNQSSPYGARTTTATYSTPASSPPSKSEGMSTGSGHSFNRTIDDEDDHDEDTSPRAKVSAPKRKATARKKNSMSRASNAEYDLVEPLSVTHPHAVDQCFNFTKEHVNRSIDERRREVNLGDGRVKRPMNSYMLYRKAWQNHAKSQFGKDNHQVVSMICGKSWRRESDSFRQRFADMAKTESENHRRAFPEYKFCPAKPAAVKSAARKGSKRSYDDENDLFDDDDDLNSTYGLGRGGNVKRTMGSSYVPINDEYAQECYTSIGKGYPRDVSAPFYPQGGVYPVPPNWTALGYANGMPGRMQTFDLSPELGHVYPDPKALGAYGDMNGYYVTSHPQQEYYVQQPQEYHLQQRNAPIPQQYPQPQQLFDPFQSYQTQPAQPQSQFVQRQHLPFEQQLDPLLTSTPAAQASSYYDAGLTDGLDDDSFAMKDELRGPGGMLNAGGSTWGIDTVSGQHEAWGSEPP